MKVTDIGKKINLKPLKLSVRETPHLTLETNLTCNIRCRGCYNLYKTYVKPLSQVKSEIDLALQKRNLETITLLGGEPTLHPDLVEIIRYTKSKKVICEMLTNGVVFLEDKNDHLLDEIIRAGLDRIVLHVDVGQSHIHQDIDGVRHRLFRKFEQRRIFFSLSITIYHDNKNEIPSLMKRFARYRYFDGIL
nr:radical SAM protein [Candidatus Aenigmarchaeota archaeon]